MPLHLMISHLKRLIFFLEFCENNVLKMFHIFMGLFIVYYIKTYSLQEDLSNHIPDVKWCNTQYICIIEVTWPCDYIAFIMTHSSIYGNIVSKNMLCNTKIVHFP